MLHTKDQHVDEIQNYLDGHYISPAEACFRVFQYDLTSHFPAVTLLEVHLKNEKTVTFRPRGDPYGAVDNIKLSSLEAF